MKCFSHMLGYLLLMGSLIPIQESKAQNINLSHSHQSSYALSSNSAMSLMSRGGSVSFVGRQQWVGLDGAPQVYMGSGHIGLNSIGATTGLIIRQDRMGVQRHNEIYGFFAKGVRLSEKDYLGLSLNAGLVHFIDRPSSLDAHDGALIDTEESDLLLGFGAVLYRPDGYYVGVSLPRFTTGGIGATGDNRYAFNNRYYFNGGLLIPLNPDLHIRPSVQMSYGKVDGTLVDGAAMVFMKRIVGLGVGARSQGDISGMLQFNFSGFGLGYSYQFNARNAPLQKHITNSTHEIGLSYDFAGFQRLL